AVLAGGQLFGFLGMLLALPVAAVANVLLRYAHARYTQCRLYAGQTPAPGTVAEHVSGGGIIVPSDSGAAADDEGKARAVRPPRRPRSCRWRCAIRPTSAWTISLPRRRGRSCRSRRWRPGVPATGCTW